MSTSLNNYGVLGESRPKGMLTNNSLVCITSELPRSTDGRPKALDAARRKG
jgi:hypothetical protein